MSGAPSNWTLRGEISRSTMKTPVLAENHIFPSGDMMQFQESFL
jgi:hypothetical protein